jgi:hypothetical protein
VLWEARRGPEQGKGKRANKPRTKSLDVSDDQKPTLLSSSSHRPLIEWRQELCGRQSSCLCPTLAPLSFTTSSSSPTSSISTSPLLTSSHLCSLFSTCSPRSWAAELKTVTGIRPSGRLGRPSGSEVSEASHMGAPGRPSLPSPADTMMTETSTRARPRRASRPPPVVNGQIMESGVLTGPQRSETLPSPSPSPSRRVSLRDRIVCHRWTWFTLVRQAFPRLGRPASRLFMKFSCS